MYRSSTEFRFNPPRVLRVQRVRSPSSFLSFFLSYVLERTLSFWRNGKLYACIHFRFTFERNSEEIREEECFAWNTGHEIEDTLLEICL